MRNKANAPRGISTAPERQYYVPLSGKGRKLREILFLFVLFERLAFANMAGDESSSFTSIV
jgi:hypothetical protein